MWWECSLYDIQSAARGAAARAAAVAAPRCVQTPCHVQAAIAVLRACARAHTHTHTHTHTPVSQRVHFSGELRALTTTAPRARQGVRTTPRQLKHQCAGPTASPPNSDVTQRARVQSGRAQTLTASAARSPVTGMQDATTAASHFWRGANDVVTEHGTQNLQKQRFKSARGVSGLLLDLCTALENHPSLTSDATTTYTHQGPPGPGARHCTAQAISCLPPRPSHFGCCWPWWSWWCALTGRTATAAGTCPTCRLARRAVS